MGNRVFKISTARLGKDAEQFQQLVADMKKIVGNMQSSVGQMNAMWEGVSKDNFVRAFADDIRAVTDVLNELESLYNYEIMAKEQYENCENQVADLVANMRV